MPYVKKLLAVGTFVAAAAAATQSQATTYLLTASQNFGAGSYGSVQVTQDGANALKYVVTLTSGYNFTDTGQHKAFAFSLEGDPTLGLSTTKPLPTSYVTLPSGFSLTDSPDNVANPPFGAFDYGLNCSACSPSNGGKNPSSLTFYVTAPKITTSWIEAASNAYGGHDIYFAADVIKTKDCSEKCTGAVGAFEEAVPEPATWALMGLGVFAAGAALRRRRPGAVRSVPA